MNVDSFHIIVIGILSIKKYTDTRRKNTRYRVGVFACILRYLAKPLTAITLLVTVDAREMSS